MGKSVSKLVAKLLSLLSITFFLGGCALHHIPIEESFRSSKNPKVGLVVKNYPRANLYFNDGREIEKDVVSASMNQSLVERIEKTKLKPLFQNEFEKQFIDVIYNRFGHATYLMPEFIEKLKPFSNDNSDELRLDFAKTDYRKLKKKGIDYLLVLEIMQVGLQRPYYGQAPIAAPSGYAKIRIDVISIKTNKVVWRETRRSEALIDGEWDLPPNFDSAVTAVEASFRRAMIKILFTMKEQLDKNPTTVQTSNRPVNPDIDLSSES
ncbi:hypothetical protein [Pseudobacteriovorax antillogorgiicola]|uniref:Lipoprotein n=1 Tax=Pseudobacteriovorax antillogorgiicola TaxID=1513793 RepID=A0A1Y6CKV6_9BACT|nr:hypothetical protein [Pseudobacteriovorax antillogorgiicola]TCS48225.1 hypothetical protein EDD56_1185 [Pseudobacteriovorax antillogorgiicola]SMF57357.1 hypothetical protein SAMN06296036_118136 [Pseudobacteriovorax antillogorgiicola]